MCMACPQKVVAADRDAVVVSFRGSRKIVRTPIKVRKGDYVLCQQNVVVQKISKRLAGELMKEWKQMEASVCMEKGDEAHA